MPGARWSCRSLGRPGGVRTAAPLGSGRGSLHQSPPDAVGSVRAWPPSRPGNAGGGFLRRGSCTPLNRREFARTSRSSSAPYLAFAPVRLSATPLSPSSARQTVRGSADRRPSRFRRAAFPSTLEHPRPCRGAAVPLQSRWRSACRSLGSAAPCSASPRPPFGPSSASCAGRAAGTRGRDLGQHCCRVRTGAVAADR